MGLIPYTHPDMDLPSQRHRGTDAFSHTSRGDLLLHHPNLQHHATLPPSQQTNVPSDLLVQGGPLARGRGVARTEDFRTIRFSCDNYHGCRDGSD